MIARLPRAGLPALVCVLVAGAGRALAQDAPSPWVDPPARARTAPLPSPAAPPPVETPAPRRPAADPPAVVIAPDASTARPPASASSGPSPEAPRAAERAEPPPSAAPAPSATRRAAAAATVRRHPRPTRSAAAVVPSAAEPLQGDLAGYAGAARQLTLDYLDAMSGSGPVGAASLRFYGSRVMFHGRPVGRAELLAEKRRFTMRWPERSYRPYLAELAVGCNAGLGTCVVRTPFRFAAESAARGASSRGVGTLVLGVHFVDGRPIIASEASRVLVRDRVARAPAPAYGSDDDDDEE